MNILVVDDSSDSRLLIEEYLRSAGYRDIEQAGSAEDALKVLEGDSNVDIILMDVIMPDIDGIETVRQIKAKKELQGIPIVMVTVDTDVNTLHLAFDAGAVDYITKPIKKGELLARVSSMLKLKAEMDARKERERRLAELTKELEEKNQILERLSFIDALTGVGNRRLFNEILEKEWKRAGRDVYPLSLIMMDIDFFKDFNDTYGHLMGDDCLRKVAEALNKTIKRPADLIARYGGEEFAAILPDTDEQNAVRLAEDMRNRVEDLNITHVNSEINKVTISLGVAAVIPHHNLDMASLISSADKALYHAKQEGRNMVKTAAVAEHSNEGIKPSPIN